MYYDPHIRLVIVLHRVSQRLLRTIFSIRKKTPKRCGTYNVLYALVRCKQKRL